MTYLSAQREWPDASREWTAEEHRIAACELLDHLHIDGDGVGGEDGEPLWRFYTAVDQTEPDEPADYAPFLAAIAHALLAGGGS